MCRWKVKKAKKVSIIPYRDYLSAQRLEFLANKYAQWIANKDTGTRDDYTTVICTHKLYRW
ncbi:Uncharacterised protein [Sphingobacterium multivorum]|uniref:Uncharacterized protein n=1 Tax=Sphingobacterium multivorum TaxID=28454 RepID=A0A2X2J0R5_SPHMU|nr:hypothetical protein [Sphingobacterium multivorum]SPZ85133.1 Uncharacterised protein [Sphingobacterium multivorum]